MKKFKVLASFSTYCAVFIEAENQEQAEELALDMDGGQFEPAGADFWRIESANSLGCELTLVYTVFKCFSSTETNHF